ncbi:cysteine--tRNA ligase [Dokdonella immobilis]|uniref:Cysteine--tRNA ligase n=1 Tax=Dokdonella immobilis TaxID=578942 RepID=A0A1I4X0P5_9GAMM|nr:cysteine--tRNA ligase [Dokdonella immobilis]SFN19564.1 cysteinyl-tRNA synthetase [Dokdonella immobilis]
MNLRLHNSMTRRVEDFVPLDPERITMYVCGPTVYNYIHVGNARPAVVFGLLARLLRRHHKHVVYARNITDVDDKINAAAREAGAPIATITTRFAQAYHEDLARLGVDPPDIVPHATAHIAEIIAMCERLIASGHAYAAENHVLFDVESYADYGKLSGRSTEDMIAGARIDVAPYKKGPGDFVLWKPSTDDLPGWDSPWGRGRPGWHIECSAMAEAHLGDTIDIHAGGNDLMFPHHENEIAQSTCAHGGKVFARYWLHNGMLTFGGRKMSKSLGNVMILHELLEKYPPEVLRFLLLRAHYRQPLDWSESTLAQSRATLDGWYGVLRDRADIELAEDEWIVTPDFEAALCDDLNTPAAFAILSGLADEARKAASAETRRRTLAALLGCARLIGLLQEDPENWFKQTAAGNEVDADWVQRLLEERVAARAARDFSRADRIREELAARGVVIEDGAGGTRWKVVEPGQTTP